MRVLVAALIAAMICPASASVDCAGLSGSFPEDAWLGVRSSPAWWPGVGRSVEWGAVLDDLGGAGAGPLFAFEGVDEDLWGSAEGWGPEPIGARVWFPMAPSPGTAALAALAGLVLLLPRRRGARLAGRGFESSV